MVAMSKSVVLKVLLLVLVGVIFSSFLASDAWRSSPKSLVENFNTTFWDNGTTYPPLEMNVSYIGNTTVGGVVLDEYDAFFNSHFFNGTAIRIHAVILKPPGEDLPAVLLLHGTGGSHLQLIQYGRALSSHGYVVVLMDSPGCGLSSGPTSSPENTVDFSGGPYSAYYYHNVIAARRAITAISELPYVNPDAIAVSGASMGGVATYLVAATDSRVKAAIPVVASGYFDEIVMGGSFANFIVPPGANFNDQAVMDLIKYFDCRAYAANLSVPTLLLIGTHDEFFFIEAVNKTYSIIPCDKAINLAPNTGHAMPDNRWLVSSVIWLDHYLKGSSERLPSVPVPSAEPANFYTSIRIVVPDPENVSVFYRDGLPGSLWVEQDLSKGDLLPMPLFPTTVSYFIGIKSNGTIVSTSPVYQISVVPSAFVISLAFLVAVMLVLFINWREEVLGIEMDASSLLLFIAGLLIWIVAAFATSLPWIDFTGRTSVSLLQLWDRYALHFAPFALLLLGLFGSLLAFAARIWLGGLALLFTFGWVYYFLIPLTSLSPSVVSLGFGAYLVGICIAASFLIPAVLKIVRG
ncbi:MAG: alpha/beta fold hydrolase [Candidatus Methanosuratincola verstraetei]|jgi:cephalosporin-C deacetylase-like acetyl esterase|uniref:Alpha/beta fold hydrolase n=1 Tax=Candidatus Methanosuratincola petrocarbonis (ex Vanwonterghem et al. 2016) TaxID=1867261 RepID=A0A7J3V0X6_9CREN